MPMGAIPKIVSLTFVLAVFTVTAARHIKNFLDLRKRRRLEAEITSIADDLQTDPTGMSLKDAVYLLEIPMVEEILLELRKMPIGARSLQHAIEITGDENYGKTT